MDTTNLLSQFKDFLRVHGRSPGTIRTYMYQTRCFLHAMEVKDVRRVTSSQVENYIETLYQEGNKTGKPYAVGTISVKIRAVKRFFEYLLYSNQLLLDPCEPIKEPRLLKHLPCEILSLEQMTRILDQPDSGSYTGIRDRAILEVFCSTGIRMAELCRLSVFDADLQGGTLRVNDGKGGKDRIVPMGRHAVQSLNAYIVDARPHLTNASSEVRNLFVNRFGKPLSSQVVGLMIRKNARQAGIPFNVTAHTFRRSFASALIKNGADIVAVKEMLGHAFLKTTQQYIRALGIDIKAVHRKTHPREIDASFPFDTTSMERRCHVSQHTPF